MSSVIWRHSRKDFFLFLTALAQLASLFAWCLNFNSISTLTNILIGLGSTILFYFNPIVVTHNFLHCPFFKIDYLNKAFGIINSMNFGLPQILYKHHHIAHHQHNNDQKNNHTTKDPSSTYRFGKNGRQEHFIPYCGLGLFRDGTEIAFKSAIQKKSDALQLLLQTLSSIVFHGVLIYLNWQWYLVCYAPVFYFGWFLAHMENYYEHFKATDTKNRFSNSVSYYNRFYNFLMFNEGYHQEHHIQPSIHWTKRPEVKNRFYDKMKSENVYVAKFPPLLGFLE
jgi:fatty acid desaturase